MTAPIDLKYYLAAAEICRAGGTPSDLHGQACLLAGVPITPLRQAPTVGVEVVCRMTDAETAMTMMAAGVLALDDDGEVVKALLAAWGDDDVRVVRTLFDAWWGDGRVARALLAAWWDDVRVARALLAAWWDDVRVVKALSDAWDDDGRVAKVLLAAWE